MWRDQISIWTVASKRGWLHDKEKVGETLCLQIVKKALGIRVLWWDEESREAKGQTEKRPLLNKKKE